ncbi:MAG: hypothetical protein IH946_11910 [Bacteroidetes bacterium]|nr:hypothetical protein [Bacteroidota bacterium]
MTSSKICFCTGFILIICCNINSLAQTQYSNIGFKILPGYTDRHDPFEGVFQEEIVPRFTTNFGLQLQLHDSLFFFETGIYHTDRDGFQKGAEVKVNTTSGSYTLITDKYVHSYYLSVPLLVGIKLRELYVSIGFTIDYFLHTQVIWAENESIKVVNILPSRFYLPGRFKLGFDMNLGYQYELIRKVNVFIEGSLNLSTFSKAPIGYYYFLNYEIGIGLNYKIQ